MARILDGSITIDDELNEVQGNEMPLPLRRAAELKGPEKKRRPDKSPRGKLKPGAGLTGRSTKERLKIRAWISEQGFDISPTGRIPQKYLDAYDEHMRIIRDHRKGEQELPIAQ
jgi:hypothetical protein